MLNVMRAGLPQTTAFAVTDMQDVGVESVFDAVVELYRKNPQPRTFDGVLPDLRRLGRGGLGTIRVEMRLPRKQFDELAARFRAAQMPRNLQLVLDEELVVPTRDLAYGKLPWKEMRMVIVRT